MAEIRVGVERERQGEAVTCDGCGGKGVVPGLAFEDDWPDDRHNVPVKCSQCRGAGYLMAESWVPVSILVMLVLRP